MSFGTKVAEERKKLNMTQEQLADLLVVTRQTISRWESDVVFPDMEKIVKLANILNVSCDYLLRNEGEKEKATLLTRLLLEMKGKYVQFDFYEDMGDYDCYARGYKILLVDFDNSWVRVRLESHKKGTISEKLINLASISAIRTEVK